jgi:hypothetical protein
MYDRNGNLISTLSATADGMKITGELSASTISGLGSPSAFSSSVVSKFNTLGTYTGSVDTRLTEIGVVSGSLILSASATSVSVSNLNTFSGSQLTQNSALATISGSLISTASNHEQRIAANESVSSSYARTNSTNIFSGDQTITGSLYVSSNLIVQGSSSIQNISSSTLNIGTNLITVNTLNPGTRFGGLAVIDSGSSPLISGSILFDSINDQWIFVHQAVSGAATTSSVFLMGPQTYNSLGSEVYPTTNRVVKSINSEHIGDSNITDDGTTISLGSNVTITGSVTVSGTVDGVDVSVLNSNINSFSSSALTRLSALEVETSNLESFTSSINTTIKSKLDADGVISSSAQLTTTFDARYLNTGGDSVVSGSSQITLSSTTGGGTSDNVRFGSLGIGMAASGTSGRIDAANDVVAFSTSDIRLKENITPIPNAIEKIRKISGNTYDWKAELKDVHGYEGNDVGVIAQEVEEVLPQLVQDRDNGYKAVKYDKLVALLIEGIKEQQQHIDNLTIQVEELKKQKGL